jgi:hypothetical protein
MSKSTKKSSAKKPKNEAPEPINQLPKEEHQALQIVVLERNNAQLAFQNLQQQLQAASERVQEKQSAFEKAVTTLNSKYNLDPSKDGIDITTGAITRGQ